jgi:hypothetical protein
MSPDTSNRMITIRATWTTYLVLSGIWIILAIGYLFLALRAPGKSLELGALISAGVAILWVTWIRGFRITLSQGWIEYRDGFFRCTKVLLKEIADIQRENLEWKLLGRKLAIPRIAVITKDRAVAMRINSKPFGRIGLQRILKELKKGEVTA